MGNKKPPTLALPGTAAAISYKNDYLWGFLAAKTRLLSLSLSPSREKDILTINEDVGKENSTKDKIKTRNRKRRTTMKKKEKNENEYKEEDKEENEEEEQ